MRRVIILQIVLALVCAGYIVHSIDARADYVHAQRGAK